MKDLTGQRFGRLVVVRDSGKRYTSCKSILWECKCDCGKIINVASPSLTKGLTRSCGCLRDERRAEVHTAKLEGKRFGHLVVIEKTDERAGSFVKWRCKCDCGNECLVSTHHLNNGDTRTCGPRCPLHLQIVRDNLVVWKTPDEYRLVRIWSGIHTRCYNQNDTCYKNYGGRGIKMCDEWLSSKRAFVDWGLANGYRRGLSIDRIDNNGNYCPENCRWTTNAVQSNNKTTNHILTVHLESMTISQWGKKLMFPCYPQYIASLCSVKNDQAAIDYIASRLRAIKADRDHDDLEFTEKLKSGAITDSFLSDIYGVKKG